MYRAKCFKNNTSRRLEYEKVLLPKGVTEEKQAEMQSGCLLPGAHAGGEVDVCVE